MVKKILFYKRILIEVLETLQTICYALAESRITIENKDILLDHAKTLRQYSTKIRDDVAKER